jgi:hypothetical protein
MIVPLDHTICEVMIDRRTLCVEFVDGRQVCAPLEWFPLLSAAAPADRDDFRIADDGLSVSWPKLGERVSAEFLLARRQSVARQAG